MNTKATREWILVDVTETVQTLSKNCPNTLQKLQTFVITTLWGWFGWTKLIKNMTPSYLQHSHPILGYQIFTKHSKIGQIKGRQKMSINEKLKNRHKILLAMLDSFSQIVSNLSFTV